MYKKVISKKVNNELKNGPVNYKNMRVNGTLVQAAGLVKQKSYENSYVYLSGCRYVYCVVEMLKCIYRWSLIDKLMLQ